jgi:hypothetical protein
VDVFLNDPKVAWRMTTRKGATHYLAKGRFPAFCDAEGLSTLDDLTTDKLDEFLGPMETLGASRSTARSTGSSSAASPSGASGGPATALAA